MRTNNKTVRVLFEILLFVLVCWGAHAWFTWGFDFLSFGWQFLLRVSFAAVAYFYAITNKITLKPSSPNILFASVCYILAVNLPFTSIGEFAAQLILFFPVYVLLCDKVYLRNHLRFISIAISILLVPGIFLYLFRMFDKIPFGGIPIIYGDLSENESYSFVNYFFMLVRIWNVEDLRFTSVFLEPGYLGSLLAFLLYANNYNFKKKYNIIFLVGLVLSFSLAGYITSILGYLFVNVGKNKKRINVLLKYCLFLLVLFYGAQYYNGGNNMINKLIIERLEYDKEKGISGNDRFTLDTDVAFEKVVFSDSIYFGNRTIKNIEGAGYKVFIIRKGIIPFLLFALFYYFVSKKAQNRIYRNGFLLLVFLTFLQAAYLASYSWLIPFILGINICNKNENIVYNTH